MNTNSPTGLLTRVDYPEAIVIQIAFPRLVESDQLSPLWEIADRCADDDNRPMILDLDAVEFLGSLSIGGLMKLRKKLMQRGRRFQPPCRRRGLFAIFVDQAQALEAIRQGETDPLLLCSSRPHVWEVFAVC